MTKLPTKLNAPQVPGLRNLAFVPGAAIRLDYSTIELSAEDRTVGVKLVSADLIIRPGQGQVAILTKSITTSLTTPGQITDDGGTNGVGALWISTAVGESTTWTTRKVFQVIVTDSLGRTTRLDAGYLVPITGLETDYAPVDRVVIEPNPVVMNVGSTRQTSAVAVDDQGNALTNRTLTWVSSNTGVATVNGTGLVTAVGVGNATISVTADDVTGEAAVSVAAAFADTFTRDDDPTGLGIADTGQMWKAYSGVFGVHDGNARFESGAGSNSNMTTLVTTLSDLTVSALMVLCGSAWRIVSRVSDANNGFILQYDLTTLTLYRMQAGSTTTIWSATVAIPFGSRVGLDCRAAALTPQVDGVAVSTSATDSFNQTAVEHGIGTWSDLDAYFDDFKAEA